MSYFVNVILPGRNRDVNRHWFIRIVFVVHLSELTVTSGCYESCGVRNDTAFNSQFNTQSLALIPSLTIPSDFHDNTCIQLDKDLSPLHIFDTQDLLRKITRGRRDKRIPLKISYYAR